MSGFIGGPSVYLGPDRARRLVRVLIRRQQRRDGPLYQEQRCSDHTTNTEDHCSSLSRPSSSHPAVTTSHPEALSPLANMLVLFSLLTLLGTLSSFTSATALTYKLTPNEKECFYTHVVKQGAKVAFYFAVQSGGSFDSRSH
jgi:hypothetical protein